VKKDEIKIGETYTAKVSDKVVPVRLDKENPRGGWDATNLVTNKQVRIKSAQRLRGRVSAPATDADASKAKPAAKPPVKKKLSAAERKARAAEERAQAKAEIASGSSAQTEVKRGAGKSGTPGSERVTTSVVPKPQKKSKASGLDVAAQVLKDAKHPMRCKDIVQVMLDKGLWSTNGKTPHATIYAAILREIQTKGDKARFRKTDRGQFTLAKGA
jgi:hypothetical protein